MRWWILCLAVWTSAVAWAHPLSKTNYSLRTAIQVEGETADVVVVLEVPFSVVTEDLKGDLEKAREAAAPAKAAQDVLDAYTQRHWAQLAKGLTLTVDGEAVPGAWKPRANRLNGKGAVSGGFFLYIVEFVPAGGALPLDDDVTFVVDNQGYQGLPMVYSAMVVSGKGWKVAHSSASALLPDRPYDLNAPDFWVEDPALRHLVARYTRTPAP
ncbi:MAG: hypothetical protein KC656_29460 [Myxococcales bacterium]|nr:hypothetical protein [Myxococcales bacterium]